MSRTQFDAGLFPETTSPTPYGCPVILVLSPAKAASYIATNPTRRVGNSVEIDLILWPAHWESTMKMLPLLFVVLVLATLSAHAQSQWLETTDEARQRHSAERWMEYEQRRAEGRDWAPLGGYPERLGDTAPPGTESPGYTSPNRPGYTSPNRMDAFGNPLGDYR